MVRVLDAWLAVVFVSVAGALACHERAAAPKPSADHAPHETEVAATKAAPVATVDPTRLPEDPIAGKRSEAQWREHMAEEEHERQLGFDQRRLKQHRALVRLIAAARARYDHAGTEAAVAKTRTAVAGSIVEMRKRVTEIDRWGVNSRLLADYAALEAALADGYPDAKVSALRGDNHALADVRAGFDQHMKTIADWLKAAQESEEEQE